MGIGAINGMNNGYRYQNNAKKSGNATDSFNDVLGGATVTCSSVPGLVLHMSKEGDAEKSIGSWADAISGKSITVYKPADFDENNPVYRVKIWDTDGNVTERMVDISELDVGNCDDYDMYAYACHLSDSGEYPNAMTRFMMAHVQHQGEKMDHGGTYDLDTAKNWVDVLQHIMKQQYDVGNLSGYVAYKKFWEFLVSKS